MSKETKNDAPTAGILVELNPMSYWKCKRTGITHHGPGANRESSGPFRVTQAEYDRLSKPAGGRSLLHKVDG